MFIRIAWNGRRQLLCRPALRKNEIGGGREADDLGVPPRDFSKMTRGLFDKQD